MKQVKTNFFIGKRNFKKCLETIKKLNPNLGSAGSLVAGVSVKTKITNYFVWVNKDFSKRDNLEECFNDWRWQILTDQNGNIFDIFFEGERLGDDIILFEAIAPYVRKGSFIEMNGEEGERFKWIFDGKECIRKYAKITYE